MKDQERTGLRRSIAAQVAASLVNGSERLDPELAADLAIGYANAVIRALETVEEAEAVTRAAEAAQAKAAKVEPQP